MTDHDQLCAFLVHAKMSTYAAGDKAVKIFESDGSTTMIFEEDDWKYHDNYFGGEPYGGREVVFYQEKPVYMMVYYGWVLDNVKDVQQVYQILQEALMLIPQEKPFRGPQKFEKNDLVYENIFEGEIENFFGEEKIMSQDRKTCYVAKYMGGMVDQRR